MVLSLLLKSEMESHTEQENGQGRLVELTGSKPPKKWSTTMTAGGIVHKVDDLKGSKLPCLTRVGREQRHAARKPQGRGCWE
jgi:hypothetical protein